MSTVRGRDASIYWSTNLIRETRNVAIDLGIDFIEDTVHGDTVRSYAPTFSNFGATVTGLYNDVAAGGGAAGSKQIISDAMNQVSATWSIYIGYSLRYFYGSGFVGVDEVGSPYDDFAPFNWTIRSIGTVGFYQA